MNVYYIYFSIKLSMMEEMLDSLIDDTKYLNLSMGL